MPNLSDIFDKQFGTAAPVAPPPQEQQGPDRLSAAFDSTFGAEPDIDFMKEPLIDRSQEPVNRFEPSLPLAGADPTSVGPTPGAIAEPVNISPIAMAETLGKQLAPTVNKLAGRAAKQYLNKSILDIAEKARPSSGVVESVVFMTQVAKDLESLPEDPTFWQGVQSIPKIWWSLISNYYAPRNKAERDFAVKELDKLRPAITFDVPRAEGAAEKAVDITAGIGAFVTQLLIVKKLIPTGTVLSDVVAWEILNQAEGGIPGQGAAIRGSLGALGKIPTVTAGGKAAKIAAGGGLFGGLTAVQGGNFEDIAVSTAIGAGFQAWGVAKQAQWLKGFKRELLSAEKVRVQGKKAEGMRRNAERYQQDLTAAKTPEQQTKASSDLQKRNTAVTRNANTAIEQASKRVDKTMADVTLKLQHGKLPPPKGEAKFTKARAKALKQLESGDPKVRAAGQRVLDFLEKKAVGAGKETLEGIPEPTVAEKVAKVAKKPAEAVQRVRKQAEMERQKVPPVAKKAAPVAKPPTAPTAPAVTPPKVTKAQEGVQEVKRESIEKGISLSRAQELTGQKQPSAAGIRQTFGKMQANEQIIVIENIKSELAELQKDKKQLLQQRKEAFVPDKPLFTGKIKSTEKLIVGRKIRLEKFQQVQAKKPNILQQRNIDALAQVLKDHPEADNPVGTTKIRMTNPKGAVFQIFAKDVETKLSLDPPWTLTEKAEASGKAQLQALVDKPFTEEKIPQISPKGEIVDKAAGGKVGFTATFTAGDFGTERLVTVTDVDGNVVGQPRDPFFPQGIPVSEKARKTRIRKVVREIVVDAEIAEEKAFREAQPPTEAKPAEVEAAKPKEIPREQEAIIEPAPSPKMEQGEAGKPVSDLTPTGKLDPTDPKEAIEITKLHAEWVSQGSKFDLRSAWVGIREQKWSMKEEKFIVSSLEYTPEQIDTAYRLVQKPIESPMPDVSLFAMPGKEKQLQAIAEKMRRQKLPKAGKKQFKLPKLRALPKAKVKQEDSIKAVYVATASESTRYALNGIWVEGENIVATDGRRMFMAKGKWGKDGLYLNQATLAKGILGKSDKKAQFPKWKDIVPLVHKSDAIIVDDLDLLWRRVRQASIIMTEESPGIIILVNKDGSLGFSAATPEVGHSEINVWPGARILAGVNPMFLIDAIAFHATRGDTSIEFYFQEADRPILTRSPDGKTSTILMPVEIGEVSEELKESLGAKKAARTAAVKAEKVKKHNFTTFAREHGFVDDFSVLDHGQLSPSGKRSKRAHTESMRRMEDRMESNKKGHEAFRKAILAGEVIDIEGKVTKEGLLAEQKERAAKKVEGRVAQIDAQIRFTRDLGKGKRGLKPTARKQINALEEERKQLISAPTEVKEFTPDPTTTTGAEGEPAFAGVAGKPGGKRAKPWLDLKKTRSPNDDIEAFFGRTEKMPGGFNLKKIMERVRFVLRGAFLTQTPHLETVPRTAFVRDLIRTMPEQQRAAREKAVLDILAILEGDGSVKSLDHAGLDLLRRKVFIQDLVFEAKIDRSVSGDFTLEQLQAEDARLLDLINQVPSVKKAYEARQALWKKVSQDLFERGVLNEESRDNVSYVRHFVLEYMENNRKPISTKKKKLKEPFRTSKIRRIGSRKDISTDYLAVEVRALADIYADNVIEDIADSIAAKEDRKQEFKATAKAKNITLKEVAEQAGYVEWHYKRPNLFYRAATMDQAKIAAMIEEYAVEAGDTINVPRNMIHTALVLGRREGWYIPEDLAMQLDDLPVNYRGHPIIEGMSVVSKHAIQWWKRWILRVNPFRYNARNQLGDTERFIASGKEKALKRIPQSLKILVMKTGEYYEGAKEFGAIASSLWHEMGDVSKLREFEQFKDFTKKKTFKQYTKNILLTPLKAVQGVGNIGQSLTQLREDVLRLALYIDTLEDLRAGKKVQHWAGSIADIEAIAKESKERAAAKVSRETLIDYGSFTIFEDKVLRNGLLPFYSFKKRNLTFWPRALVNAAREGTGGQVAAIAASKATFNIAKWLIRVMFMYAVGWLWNHRDDDSIDKEESMAFWLRANPHLNIGDKTIWGDTALADFGEWIDYEGLSSINWRHQAGYMDTREAALEAAKVIAQAPFNNLAQALNPFIKAPVTAVTGQTIYPNIFDPRFIASPASKKSLERAILSVLGSDARKFFEAAKGDRRIEDTLYAYFAGWWIRPNDPETIVEQIKRTKEWTTLKSKSSVTGRGAGEARKGKEVGFAEAKIREAALNK